MKDTHLSSNINATVTTSLEEQLKLILLNAESEIQPSYILKHILKLKSDHKNASVKAKKDIEKEVNEYSNKAVAIYSLSNHFLIAEGIADSRLRTLVIELSDQLINEYNCDTTSKKIIAQTASWAFCRKIELNSKLNNLFSIEIISNEKNGYYSLISKEADRCTRQYLAAISMLKQFNQPAIKVSVNSKNAFVASNQNIHQMTSAATARNS